MGILSGPIDMDPKKRKAAEYPRVAARPGLELVHRGSGVRGVLVSWGSAKVVLRDRNGRDHAYRPRDGEFLLDGKAIALRPPKPAAAGAPKRTASGSIDAGPVPARIARASRIYVEGLHDAELVEKVWGDDLRVEGVVVEHLGGMDDLEVVVMSSETGMPDMHPQDVGWVYVSIGGDGFGEAITVTVTQEQDEMKIRTLEWGRP